MPLIHQTAMAQLAARRVGTADTMTRGQVRGGGRKPWRQKGTGRARQGTRSAPHWRGGGVVFGPHPRDYAVKVNDKVRRAALRGTLSSQGRRWGDQGGGGLRPGRHQDPCHGRAPGRLGGRRARSCWSWPARDEIVERSAANLRQVRIILADSLNVVDLLEADTIVFTRDAVTRATEVFA